MGMGFVSTLLAHWGTRLGADEKHQLFHRLGTGTSHAARVDADMCVKAFAEEQNSETMVADCL